MDDEESEWPRPVGVMKRILHPIHQQRHFQVKVLSKVSCVLKSFFHGFRLIDTRDRFADWPLVSRMGFGDVDSEKTDASGRIRANKRARTQDSSMEKSRRHRLLLHSLSIRPKGRSARRASHHDEWLVRRELREETGEFPIGCVQGDVTSALTLIDETLSDLIVFH